MERQGSMPGKYVKVPFLMLLMIAGLILEALVELPFAVLCGIDRFLGRKLPRGSERSLAEKSNL